MNASPLRLSLLAAVLGSALSAQAVQIGLSSKGTYDLANLSAVTATESVLDQDRGLGALTSLTLHVASESPVGTATYAGPGGTLAIDLVFSADYQVAGFSEGYAGRWTVDPAASTGTYKGVVGSGVFTSNYDLSGFYAGTSTKAASYSTLRGEITPVPEPMPTAALGLGTLVLLRRRKRAGVGRP